MVLIWSDVISEKNIIFFVSKQVRLWDLPQRKCIRNFRAHNGYVRGITFLPGGQQFVTVGDDKTIKMWKTDLPDWGEEEEPTNTYISKVTSGNNSLEQ